MLNNKPSRIAAAVALAIGLSATATAQETSSSVRGVIVSQQTGEALSNASVLLTDERTGSSRTLTANDNGLFSARGLAVGGPYTVVVTDSMGNQERLENVFLTLGETENLNIAVEQQSVERIQVSGRVLNMTSGSNSPSSTFNLRDLQDAPAINRDIKDVVRIDPRLYIDESFSRGIQCAGANPRFNSLTVDGVRTNDNFGLNSSGYPTERMPFSYDAIEQVAVELAPFDVQYGGFTACNINAVTKSGENELFGSVFYDYTNDSMQGDTLEGDDINVGDFTEKRFGINAGGAILKDKLFWFAAYEKLEGADTFDRGPEGSNAATIVEGVTEADVERIAAIARDVYGFEPGYFPASLPVEDEKFLVKLDWYINDSHRASFTYNYNDGYSIAQSDGDSTELEFSNHYYERGSEFTSYIAQVYSDWTYNFSTEVRVGYSELDARVLPLGGTEVGEIQLEVGPEDNEDVPTIYLGADDSRHSNKLKYDTSFFKVAGTYLLNDHTISFGLESESYDVYNLFVQETEGEFIFRSIDDFENGVPYAITYENAAGTNNPIDGAGQFKYSINTVYAQDEYYMIDQDLTLTFGLRYDWYKTSDAPAFNQDFADTYGFANNATVDGEGLLQPRFGANWVVNDQLEMRGGIGLYSGGNPNVWLSNNYSNNGTKLYEVYFRNGAGDSLFDIPHNGTGRPLFDIPQDMVDEVAAANGGGPINVLDPNFELPTEWKYALGATYTFESGYVVMADLLHSQKKNAAIISDLRRTEAGGYGATDTGPDGRPIYPSLPPSYAGGPVDAFMLTNVDGDAGDSTSLSLAVTKQYDWGLNWSFAYAYTKSEDVNPMTSSVAYSNYTSVAVSDFQDPGVATSNYEIPHRFTLNAQYRTEFFDGYTSTFSLFGQANKGRPYSFVMSGPSGDITGGRQLFYIPTGADDENFVAGAEFDTEGFFDYLDETGLSKYAGGISPRNEFNSSWWHKVDFRFEQEMPGFADGHKAAAFFVIDNLTNLINDDWGVLYERSFPRMVNLGSVEYIEDGSADGAYQYNSFRAPANVQSRVGDPSLWSVRIGVTYDF
ncbi:TonB-dependent receptor [Pseudidiomarina gelatinasegens]|uniref:TonB-dependent receptor n=1 Tax=Pseudidiomarina gelatinasegens TaxID=2487740 RepID=UPI003A973BD2